MSTTPLNPKLKKTTISLMIAGAIYLLLGLLAVIFALMMYSTDFMLYIAMVIVGVVCWGLGGLNFWVISGLKNKKRWAWITGIILCCTYITSIFLPLGIIGLIGLLDREVTPEYK